jgi:hypothetical protein
LIFHFYSDFFFNLKKSLIHFEFFWTRNGQSRKMKYKFLNLFYHGFPKKFKFEFNDRFRSKRLWISFLKNIFFNKKNIYTTVYTRKYAHGLISKILEIGHGLMREINFFSSFKLTLKYHFLSESRSVKKSFFFCIFHKST